MRVRSRPSRPMRVLHSGSASLINLGFYIIWVIVVTPQSFPVSQMLNHSFYFLRGVEIMGIMIEKIRQLPRLKLNYNLGIILPTNAPHVGCPGQSGFIVGATKLYKFYLA